MAREWGEEPQIRQAPHYARKDYGGSLTVDQSLQISSGAYMRSCGIRLTTSVVIILTLLGRTDGYVPSAKVFCYYMMMSQQIRTLHLEQADSGPMVYIANAMTPFSPRI